MLGAGSQLWEVTRKSIVLKGKLLGRFNSLPSSLIRVPRDLVIFLLLLQMGDTLTNGDFPYKCKCLLQKGNFHLVFRASPVSAVS